MVAVEGVGEEATASAPVREGAEWMSTSEGRQAARAVALPAPWTVLPPL